MSSFSFIHAADLHLDATFKGISHVAPQVGALLQDATFEALERLTALALSEQPDFVVLAGDIYNQEDKSLKARFALRDACKKLDAAGIPVFIVHGNHDPLLEADATFSFPKNVHVFGTEASFVPVTDARGELLTIVHGISHGKVNEKRKLIRQFSRAPEDVFQVGVLHCTVDAVAASDVYAPANLKDFGATGIDYWALGHIHEQQILSREPFVAYSGNIQGLHINEQGERGCLLVRVEHGVVHAEPRTLGSIQWHVQPLDITSLEQVDTLEQTVEELLEALMQELPDRCRGVIVRLVLEGRSLLDGELRKNGAVKELTERVRDMFMDATPFVWLKDIILDCKPDVDLEALRERPDLLGEALTIGNQLTDRTDDAEHGMQELRTIVGELYGSATGKRQLTLLTDEELRQLAEEAQYLCLDLLEAE
ncbi:MAG: DNA repair exonuclease [Desulfovibrionales bacterium]|nr:DNA repair exonuclease [Desulfovibrionales bacterium]